MFQDMPFSPHYRRSLILLAGLLIGALWMVGCDGDDTDEEAETTERSSSILEYTENSSEALTQEGSDGHRQWLIESLGDNGQILLLIHEAQGGPTEPGTYPFGDEESSASTCGICLRVLTDCDSSQDGAGGCTTTLMPSGGGELEIEEIGHGEGGRFTAHLTDVPLHAVDINPQTLETTPADPDSEPLLWEAFSFDVEIQDMDADPPCGGHGQLHGDHCHCEPGYRVNPQDPLDCIAE